MNGISRRLLEGGLCCCLIGSWIGLAQDSPLDSDGDGLPDRVEIELGTDPFQADAEAHLREPVVSLPDGQIEVSWSSIPGLDYRLEHTSALGLGDVITWESVGVVSATETISHLTDSASDFSVPRFYRVVVIIPDLPDPVGPTEPIEPPTVELPEIPVGPGWQVAEPLPPATETDSISLTGGVEAGIRLSENQDGSYTVQLDRPSGTNLVREVQLEYTDASGAVRQTDRFWLALLDPDRFVPLDGEGLPVPGGEIGVASSGRLLPFEYHPMGRSPLGYGQGLVIRFPNGALLSETADGSELEFEVAEAQFGPRAPLRFTEALSVNGQGSKSLPLGPLSVADLAHVFGRDPALGFSVRAYNSVPLTWRAGALEERGIRGGVFSVDIPSFPLIGDSMEVADLVVTMDAIAGIQIPFSGVFQLSNFEGVLPTIEAGKRRPIVLTIRPNGRMNLNGSVAVRFPNGPQFRADLVLEDPFYSFRMAADGLRIPVLASLSDVLPSDPTACLVNGSIDTSKECLDAYRKAYASFIRSTLATSLDEIEGAPLGLVDSDLDLPGDVMTALGYSAVAGGLNAMDLPSLNARLDQFQEDARATQTAIELFAEWAGLQRIRVAAVQGEADQSLTASTEAALASVTEDLRQLIGNPDRIPPLEAMSEILDVLVDAAAVIESVSLEVSSDFRNELRRLVREFTRTQVASFEIQTGVFDPDDNAFMETQDRYQSYELLFTQAALYQVAVLFDLGGVLEGDEGARFVEWTVQTGTHLGRLLEGDLAAAELGEDVPGFFHSLGDYMDLVAQIELWIAPFVDSMGENGNLPDDWPNVVRLTELAEAATPLLEGELDKPRGDRTVNNHGVAIRRLLHVFLDVPSTVTFPLPPIERALGALAEPLAAAVTTSVVNDSTRELLDLLSAGNLGTVLGRRFGVETGFDWEGELLTFVVTRIIELGSEKLDWVTLDRAVGLLLEACRFQETLDDGNPERYLQEAARVLTAQRVLASNLWQSEFSRRANNPALALVDMLLPGDIQVDGVRGALAFDRSTREFSGGFSGRVVLPKFSSALTIERARFDSRGALSIQLYGATQVPPENPAFAISIPKRRPIQLRVDTGGGIALRGGVDLTLENGLSLGGHVVWDEPYYGFGFEAEGLRFDLPDEVEILVPVFLDADQFPVKTAGALNNYYRSLNATLETMAPLADLPELPAVGTPPAYEVPVIDNPLQPLDLFSHYLSQELEGLVNTGLETSMLAASDAVAHAAIAVSGLRTNIVDFRQTLEEVRTARRLAEEVKRGEAFDPVLAAELIDELAELTGERARKQFKAASEEVDDPDVALATGRTALEALTMYEHIGADDADLMIDFVDFVGTWRTNIFGSLALDVETGEVANEEAFRGLTEAQLDSRLANVLTAIESSLLLGDETADLQTFRTAYWNVTLRRREIMIGAYAQLEEADWRGRKKVLDQYEELLREFWSSYSSILNDAFPLPDEVDLLPGDVSGPLVFEDEFVRLQAERVKVLALAKDPEFSQELWDHLKALGRGVQETGQQLSGVVTERVGEFVEGLGEKANQLLSADPALDKLDELLRLLDQTVSVLALVEEMDVPELDLTVSNILPELTLRLTAIADARKAWWLLHRHTQNVLEVAGAELESANTVLSVAVKQSISDSLEAQRSMAEALLALKPSLAPYDLTLPGDLVVRRIFGDLLYRRDTNDVRVQFGGRLEFPDFENAHFEIVNATVDTAGSIAMALKTEGPLPLGDSGARVTSEASFTANRNGDFEFLGEGQMDFGDSGEYEVEVSYEQGLAQGNVVSVLSFDTKASDVELELAEDLVVFDAGFGFSFRTDDPEGRLRLNGSMGMFKEERASGEPELGQFLLSVEDLSTELRTNFENQFEFELKNGVISLPVYFTANEELGAGGPRVSLDGTDGLTVSLVTPSAENGLGLSVNGAVTFENITAAIPNVTFVEGALTEATLSFSGAAIPSFSDVNGFVKVDLPTQAIEVELRDGAWTLGGFPSGTLALGADVAIFESSGFGLDMVGGRGCTVTTGQDDLATGLTILPARGNELPVVRLDGAVKLYLPESMLSIEEPDPESETIDNDGQLAFLACGALEIEPDAQGLPVPRAELETLGFAARSMRLGGSEGLAVKQAELVLEGVDSLLNGFRDGPFVVDLSGKLEIPAGPSFTLEHARFSIDETGVPQFSVPEKAEVELQEFELFEGFPVRVTKAGIAFKANRPLPQLLAMDNLIITTSAEVGIDAEPVSLTGRVDELTFEIVDGFARMALDGFGFGIDALEIPPLGLQGQVYVRGLQNPGTNFENVYFSGILGGQLYNAGVSAAVAMTPTRLLGICLDVNAGPAGIPLGQTTLLFTGASGGVLFSNTNQDPCEFLQDFPAVAAPAANPGLQPQSARPVPDFNKYGMTWEELGDRVAEQMRRDTVAGEYQRVMLDQGFTQGNEPNRGLALQAVSTTPEQDVADLEIPCPNADCPPTTVNILCQPHPDQELFPNRVIVKFTSFNRPEATEILNELGITPESLASLGVGNADSIASQISGIVRLTLEVIIPPAIPEIVGQDLAESLNIERENVLADIEAGFRNSFRDSITSALDGEADVYEAIIQAAYAGISCPDVTVSLKGVFSQALVSSFLSVEGGGVLSSAGAVGLVGNLNVIGMPIGKFQGFAMGTDSQGLPNPSLCGTLDMQIGPISASQVRMAFTCEECITGFLEAFGGLIDCLLNESGEAVENSVRRALAKIAPEHSDLGAAALDGELTIDEKVALFGELLTTPPDTLQFSDCFVNSMIAAIESVNPVMRACATGPKIFGMPLGISPFFGAGAFRGLQFEATKSGYAGAFSFSPSKLYAETLLIPISLMGGSFIPAWFPPLDEATVSLASEQFQPMELFLAGLKGQLGSPEAFQNFIADGFERALTRSVYGVQHKINPMGLKLVDNQARIVMPNLIRHPADPRNGWPGVPEENGLPSRSDVLIAALGQEFLGNALWKGDEEDLFKVYPPGSPQAAALAGRSFGTDYFPHGGIVAAGKIALPSLLAEAPPEALGVLFGDGDIFERLEAAAVVIDDYILNVTPAGNIATYLPAPNPPIVTDDEGGALSAQELMEAILSVDPTQVALAPWYPAELIFLEGSLNGKFLGVPIVEASVEGKFANAQTGEPGGLEAISRVLEGSWLSPYLGSSEVAVRFTQTPPASIEDFFLTVRQRIQTALDAGRNQDPVELAALVEQIQSDFILGLPRTAITASLDRLRVPAPFSTWFAPGQASASFSAYSPYFDPEPSDEDPLAEVKRKGGIAVEASGSFGGFIHMPELVLAMTPPTVNELPSLHASGRVAPFDFPPNVPSPLVRLKSLTGDGFIDGAVDFGSDGEVSVLLSPMSVSSPVLTSGAPMRLYGNTPSDPVTVRSSGDWSATLEMGGAIELKLPDGTPALRFGDQEDAFLARMSGTGFSQAAVRVSFDQPLLVTAFPGNALLEQTIALSPGFDQSFELFVSSDGTFFMEGIVGSEFAAPLENLPISNLKSGARVRISNSGLTINGEFGGGALDLVGIPAVTGSLEISLTSGISFEADASIPTAALPLRYGVFQIDSIDEGAGIPLVVSNEGFVVGGAGLRLAGISSDLLTLETLELSANGDFSGIGRNGDFSIPDFFNLSAGNISFVKEGENVSLSFLSPSLTLLPNSPMQTTMVAPVERIEIQSNGQMYVDTGTRTIPLPGGGTATGRLEFGYEPEGTLPLPEVDVRVLDFGGVEVGASAMETVRLTNTGGATLVGSSVVEEGFPVFQVSPPLYVLEPGEAIDLQVYFFPRDGETVTGVLNLPSTRFEDLRVSLTGAGISRPIFHSSVAGTMDFGEQPVGGGLNRQLLVSNLGTEVLRVSETQWDGPFTVSPQAFELLPGDSQRLFLTFRPTSEVAYQSELSWTTNESNETRKLELTGVGAQFRWYKQRNGGQIVRDIYMVDENLGWAVGDQGLLLRTGNGGRAWSPVRSPTFSTLNAVAFTSDGQTGWIAANGGLVYKTEDGGAAWQPVTHENVQDPIYSWKDLAVYGDRERLVLVGENSSNGRAAFTWQNSNTSYRTLDVDGGPGLYGVSAKGRRIAAVGSNGLLVYTFNTFSWNEETVTGANVISLQGVAIDEQGAAVAVGANQVFHTVELGEDWVRAEDSGTSQLLYAVDRSGNQVWASGESGVVIRSEDGGSTWSPESVNTGSSMFAIAVKGSAVWSGGRRGEIHHRPENAPSHPLLVASSDRLDFGVRAPGRTVAQTVILRNMGPDTLSFDPPTLALDPEFSVQGADVTELAPGQVARLRVVFSPGEPGMRSGQIELRPVGDVLESFIVSLKGESAGSTWQALASPTTEQFVDIQFVSDRLAYAMTIGEVYRSTDSGETWEALNVNPPGPLGRLYFVNESLGFAIGGTSGSRRFGVTPQGQSMILKTTDGGSSWQALTTGVSHRITDIIAPNPNNTNRLYAMTQMYTSGTSNRYAVILRSTNGGTSWTTLGVPSQVFLGGQAIHVTSDESSIFVSGGNVLYRSTNGGNSWTEVVSFRGTQLIYDLEFIDDNHGWMVGESGLYRRTETGGASASSWLAATRLQSGTLRRVHFTDQNVGWMAGEGSGLNNAEPSIFRSLDGGRTWDNTLIDGSFTVRTVSGLSADEAYAGGSNGVLMKYAPTEPVLFGLLVASESINFGDVAMGEERTRTLEYVNVGNETVRIQGLEFRAEGAGGGFSYNGDVPSQVAPGESFSVSVRFVGRRPSGYDGEFRLSNDGLNALVSTDVSAFVPVEDEVLMLDTFPTGLSLLINGEARTTPVALTIRAGSLEDGVLQPGDELTVEAPESSAEGNLRYNFSGWEPRAQRVFNLVVPGESVNYTARYEVQIQPVVQIIKTVSANSRRAALRPSAVLAPVFVSEFIPTVDAPPGPWVRLSGPALGQAATISLPELGLFPLNVSAYLSSAGFDMSLGATPLQIPSGVTAGQEWLAINPGSVDLSYERGGLFRLLATSGSVTVMGGESSGTSHVSFELNTNTGGYLSSLTLDSNTPVVAGLCEFGAGSQVRVDTRDGVELDFDGRLRLFNKPDGTWVYNRDYQFRTAFQDFKIEVDDILANSPIWSEGFLSLTAGTSSPRLFVRRSGTSYEAGFANLRLGLFGDDLTINEAVSDSNGLITMEIDEIDIDFNDLIRFSTTSESMMEWNVVNGAYALRLSEGNLHIDGNDHWPSDGVYLPGFTIEQESFTKTFPFDGFTFAGLTLPGGNLADANNGNRYFRLTASEGVIGFAARTSVNTAIADFTVELNANASSLTGVASGRIEVDPILPFIREKIEIAGAELSYRSWDDTHPFSGTVSFGDFDLSARWGPGVAEVCYREVCVD